MSVEYRGKVDGCVMFGVSGPELDETVLNEVVRYVHQYSEEGVVTVEKKVKGRWKPFSLSLTHPSPCGTV
jgi:hypothetical protein